MATASRFYRELRNKIAVDLPTTAITDKFDSDNVRDNFDDSSRMSCRSIIQCAT
jgi:hypothetical protein